MSETVEQRLEWLEKQVKFLLDPETRIRRMNGDVREIILSHAGIVSMLKALSIQCERLPFEQGDDFRLTLDCMIDDGADLLDGLRTLRGTLSPPWVEVGGEIEQPSGVFCHRCGVDVRYKDHAHFAIDGVARSWPFCRACEALLRESGAVRLEA